MLLRNLIHDLVPPLKTTDTAQRALQWMDAFRQSTLPVIGETGAYMGMVYEKDLMKLEIKDVPLFTLSIPFNRLYVNEYQHIFDAIKFSANNDFTVIPFLNDIVHYFFLLTVMY
ncbi:MAG: hypothetical protein H0U44_03645, partial [Flavisolibacter sp.]|nr:hypothetical protein [Flavisolibacter sp.]